MKTFQFFCLTKLEELRGLSGIYRHGWEIVKNGTCKSKYYFLKGTFSESGVDAKLVVRS
jgi:hypothetical protein